MPETCTVSFASIRQTLFACSELYNCVRTTLVPFAFGLSPFQFWLSQFVTECLPRERVIWGIRCKQENMSEADDAAAKRAALAEARRQKILARGADRLNRITLGTPIPEATPPSTVTEPEAAPEIAATAEAPAPALAAPAPEPAGPAAPASPAQAADAPGSSANPDLPVDAPEDVAASMRQAEQAMHALLNQLSDPRPGQSPADSDVASLLQAMAAQAGAGESAMKRT